MSILISNSPPGAKGARTPKSAPVFLQVVAYTLLISSIALGTSTAFGQSPTPAPAAVEKTVQPGGVGEDRPAPTPTPQAGGGEKQKEKGEKRGSIVIAPIPISSPAFGSGLLLIAGYVFKFDKEDAVSPPSWVGAAGVRTNNGTRGLALGGRFYLKENKYQT